VADAAPGVSARPAERRVASGAETIIPRKSPAVPKGTYLRLDIDDVLLALGSRAGCPASAAEIRPPMTGLPDLMGDEGSIIDYR
jgi:hypothetical protein